jgi:GntR family transcriptional regulator
MGMPGRKKREALDKQSIIPLYRQLAEAIEKAIRQGQYPDGAKIPSESELMETYGVSRVTVRQTMGVLLERHLITRRQGMGTFVQGRVISQTMDDIFGFYPALRSKGLNPSTRILDYGFVLPDPEVREHLQLLSGEKVLRFTRQYSLEGSIWVVIQMNIPSLLAQNWTAREAAEKNSFRLLQENGGVQIGGAAVKIRAAVADGKVAKRLKISRGHPILELRRLTYSLEKRPVEYAILTFRGDAYELTAPLNAGDRNGFVLGRR